MRRAAKTDDNHREIVQTFLSIGWSVLDLSRVGSGCPDLLCAKPGVAVLIEVKDGKKNPSRRKLTPDQEKFHLSWKGEIEIVTCADDALAIDAMYSGRRR